jgi:predicted nucleic acid-binding protein
VSLVLDSSATLAWIYGDETTESIRELFDAIADSGAVVPALWRLEVANSLTVAVRRGRIDAEFRQAALNDLALLATKSPRLPSRSSRRANRSTRRRRTRMRQSPLFSVRH